MIAYAVAAVAVRFADLGRGCRRKVGPGPEQGDLVGVPADRDRAQELADGTVAAVGGRKWRHGEQRVLAQAGEHLTHFAARAAPTRTQKTRGPGQHQDIPRRRQNPRGARATPR
jgi:hypothetical protein